MRPTTVRRRASYGAVAAAVLGAVLVPLSASAADCASWTDKKGDATTDESGIALLGDSQLDIVAAALGTVGKDLVGTITTDGLGNSSSDAGDEFGFRFMVGGNDVQLYVDRTAPLGQKVDVSAGYYNYTTRKGGEATATFDVKNKTVRIVGPLAELEKAVGKKVDGLPLTELRAETYNQLTIPGLGTITPAKYDEAATPLKPVVGAACTLAGPPGPAGGDEPEGGASPGPSGGASPGASPAASAKPSAAASPAPSGSAAPSPAASPSPTGPPPPPEPEVPVPAKGCVGSADKAGDSNAAVGPLGAGNDPDLDIISVTGRTTETELAGHLGITKLGKSPSKTGFTGHRFEYEFEVGDKTVALSATGTGKGTGRVDGAASPDLVVTAVFDLPSSQVVLTVERAGLQKALGAPVPDTAVLTEVAARSYARTPATESVADRASAEDPARGRYTVGDNTCFRPLLSVTSPGRVQTSDIAVVSVALATSDGRIADGQKVTGRVGEGRAVGATTDAQGTATLFVPVTDAAGVHDLVVRSHGAAGEGELVTPVEVVVERTLLTARTTGTGSARTVTATLTDDDARPRGLSGQRVTFTFGGRTVAATTDRAGRASASVPVGSTVEVAFAGRRGFLAPARTRLRA